MIRAILITAAVAGLSMPALAADTETPAAGITAAYGLELKNQYDAKQAHNLLARKGYVNISSLDRDESGRWIGTATNADGKTIFVGVDLPKSHAAGATN